MAKHKAGTRQTTKELDAFHEVNYHYQLAKEDLQQRIPQFDKADEMLLSHIDQSNWPYQSLVFDPRIYALIFDKTSRLVGNKLRGRLVPREGGDVIKAKILNALLSFQWDEVGRLEHESMLAKWARMDLNTRRYGAAFGIVKWHYERRKHPRHGEVVYFDGPTFRVINNRDALPNPAYSTIKHWFQYREYVTLGELKRINDASQSKPTFKNLDKLGEAIAEEDTEVGGSGGDQRSVNYLIKSKQIRGVSDQLGRDPFFKVVEIVHELRNDRWITIAPRYGLVLRDIPNPYDHGQIPVILLRYYSLDDDIYGLSEIEPIASLQKGINALVNQYLDAISQELYKPLMVNPQNVQLNTLEYGPGKKWYMLRPGEDVRPFETSMTSVSKFVQTYSFLVAALNSAAGTQSVGISNIGRFNPQKTATEIRAVQEQRNTRDNFNQIFLKEALERQMMYWFLLNRQFLFSDPKQTHRIIRVTGHETIRALQQLGLADMVTPEEGLELLLDLPDEFSLRDLQQEAEGMSFPRFPVRVGGEVRPRMKVAPGGEFAEVIITPEDLTGNYDYEVDVESLAVGEDVAYRNAVNFAFSLVSQPAVLESLLQSGSRIKMREFLESYLSMVGFKDVDRFFDDVTPQGG